MPIVPMFQGGLPQTQDNGRVGRAVIEPARPSMDYARTMATATQDLNEVAGSVQKLAEVQFARDVKAASDEAETQFMQALQTRLYAPEGGYFTKQGRNANESYQGTIDGIKKDASDILGGLPDPVRQAVESRINDRMLSAQGQMMRWNSQQTQAWHVGSSQTRLNTIIESIAGNYADKDYCAASYASMDQEIDYLAKIQGFGEEQTAALRGQYWDLAQAMRYSAMAEDSPVDALTEFQANADAIMGNDVREKIARQLFQTSKPLLADLVSDNYGKSLLDKRDFVKELMRPGHKTGIAVVDALSPSQRRDVFSAAYAASAQRRTTQQSDLKLSTENSLATVAQYGRDDNALTEDQFVEVYGEKEGKTQFDSYQDRFATNAAVYNYQFMDNGQISADIEASKPVPGSATFAQDKKLYEARLSAASKIAKARRDDPVAAAIETGQRGYEPLNFGAPVQLHEQLRARMTQVDSLATDWGATRRIFSKGEAKQLTDALNKAATIDEKVALLSTIADAVGSDGIRYATDQFKDGDRKYAVALGGFDIMDASGKTAGEEYLRGIDAIEQKRVRIDPAAEVGVVASINALLGDDPSENVTGVFTTSAAQEQTAELARGIYAYRMLGGSQPGYGDAVARAIGGEVAVHNKKKTVMPRGVSEDTWFGTDFGDLVDVQANIIRKAPRKIYYAGGYAMTAKQLADDLPSLDLQTKSVSRDGSVTYSVIRDGQEILDDEGRLFTITIDPPEVGN